MIPSCQSGLSSRFFCPWYHCFSGASTKALFDRRVFLHATDESALQNGVTMDALKKFAAEPEAAGGGGSLEKKAPIQPGTTGGIARETH